MIYVGIDVAKDKHYCFIINFDGEVLYDVFTIQNNIDGFTHLLDTASKGRFKRASADQIREAARCSVGSFLPAKSLELKHTIKLIAELNDEITEIEA